MSTSCLASLLKFVCVCVALCLSGFLTACLNLSAMPASSPQSKVCQHSLRVLEVENVWVLVCVCLKEFCSVCVRACMVMCCMRVCVSHFQQG